MKQNYSEKGESSKLNLVVSILVFVLDAYIFTYYVIRVYVEL